MVFEVRTYNVFHFRLFLVSKKSKEFMLLKLTKTTGEPTFKYMVDTSKGLGAMIVVSVVGCV